VTEGRSFRELVDEAVERGIIDLRRSPRTRAEISGMVALARTNHRRALANRDDPGLAYSLLYLAFVNLADALTAAAGYAAGGEGGHVEALKVAQAYIRVEHPALAPRFAHVSNTLRRKRHEALYDRPAAVDEEDLEFAEALATDLLPVLAAGVAAVATLGRRRAAADVAYPEPGTDEAGLPMGW
jgi:hypothetical protein